MTKGLIWTIVLSAAIIVTTLSCSESPASTVTPSAAETSDEGTSDESASDEGRSDEGTSVSTGSKSPIRAAEHPELGTILVDGEGFTLYMRNNDVPNLSTCSRACAEEWPPLQASGELPEMAGEGVDPDLLGSFKRFDGAVQVSYNNSPLYSYSKDEKPGDAKGVIFGQGVSETGASLGRVEWFVISPEGKGIVVK